MLAASLAFGQVKSILSKLADVLARLGGDVVLASENKDALLAALSSFRHRIFSGVDVAALLYGGRCLQRTHGSIGACFEKHLARSAPHALGTPAESNSLAEGGRGHLHRASKVRSRGQAGPPDAFALAMLGLSRELRAAGGMRPSSHLLPDVEKGSACKRLLLFLRWMIRPDDGIDLGLWSVSPAQLVIPLDTHIHRIARCIGLTDRRDASFATARAITDQLRRLEPSDPVRYDFSLCHLGIVQRCPERRDEARCKGCGVLPVCRHWRAERRILTRDAEASIAPSGSKKKTGPATPR